jgi:hypothetical protein
VLGCATCECDKPALLVASAPLRLLRKAAPSQLPDMLVRMMISLDAVCSIAQPAIAGAAAPIPRAKPASVSIWRRGTAENPNKYFISAPLLIGKTSPDPGSAIPSIKRGQTT